MSTDKKIVIGCDHGGFELKEVLTSKLEQMDYEVFDAGTNGPESVDYPIFAERVAKLILSGEASRGILICGTGIGISISANRFNGIRASLCTSVEMARLTRQHNDSNVLALGGRTTSDELAIKILNEWLVTDYEGGRHQIRIDKIDKINLA